MNESILFLLSCSETFQSTAWELSIGHKHKKMAHPDGMRHHYFRLYASRLVVLWTELANGDSGLPHLALAQSLQLLLQTLTIVWL